MKGAHNNENDEDDEGHRRQDSRFNVELRTSGNISLVRTYMQLTRSPIVSVLDKMVGAQSPFSNRDIR